MEPIVIPENPEEAQAEDHRIIAEALKNPPQSSSELYKFLLALTGIALPWEPLCKHKGHQTPWDFVWKNYRADLDKWKKVTKPNCVFVGPRGGYKTMSVAMLIVSELLFKPGTVTVGVGAIENHAATTYQYVQRFLSHPVIQKSKIVKHSLMKETALKNGSIYSQSIATMAGVNAKHCQKMRLEEVDLMKPQIIEEAKPGVTSFNEIKINTAYVSSRKFTDGNMDNLIQNAEATDSEVIFSCYKDTAERCPVERHGKNTKTYEVDDIFNPGRTIVVEAFEFCGDCPLLPTCQSDLSRANGIVKIEDIIKDWRSMDRETWIYQKECELPKGANLFFSECFDDRLQVGAFPYRTELGPADMVFDFTGGGEDPTVVEFLQTDQQGNDYVVGELVFHKKLVGDVARSVKDYVEARGMALRHQLGDSAAQTWISELNSCDPSFFRIRPIRKIHRRDGWMVMRRRMRDNNGVRRTFISSECKLLIHELKTAKSLQNDRSDIRGGKSDHAIDAIRYRQVEVYFHGSTEPNIRFLDAGSGPSSAMPPTRSKMVRPRDIYHSLDIFDTDDD